MPDVSHLNNDCFFILQKVPPNQWTTVYYSYSMSPSRAFFTIPAFAVLSPGKDLSKYEAFSCAEMWSRTLGGI